MGVVRKSLVEHVALPMRSLVSALPFMDHADAFRMKVDRRRFANVDAFARAFLQRPPAWVAATMRTRDVLVFLFGRKGKKELRFIDRTADEILLGENDRHFDYRVSLLYEREPERDGAAVTVSTVVRFNDILGRAYFLPVRPMQGLVVQAMMRSAIERRAT